LSTTVVGTQQSQRVVHVFNQTRYSICPSDGTIFFQNIPMLENTVKVNSFALNNLKCRVITRSAFHQDNVVHLQTYVIETKIEFWNMIFNLKSMWVNNFHVEHEGERIWPSKTTVMDVAVDINNSQSVYLLRPVSFTKNQNEFYYAMSKIIFNMFINSIENVSTKLERSKRPRKVKCENCCIPHNCTSTIYLLFGKNSFIHTICCTEAKFLSDSWWAFVNEFIYFKWSTCIDEPGTLPDIDEQSLLKSSMNKLNSLHRHWRIDLENMKTREQQRIELEKQRKSNVQNEDSDEQD
jgi:hypothetical protein